MTEMFGSFRDAERTALGGKNAQPLETCIVTASGRGRVEARVPDGFRLTGGGWNYSDMIQNEKAWVVEIAQRTRYNEDTPVETPEYTAYAVCVRDATA